MKTIELMINGQKAQFTTKSVTLEGKEYFYSNVTELNHSPVVHTYKLVCDGEEKLLTYEKKDAKIMAAIFGQVEKMIALRNAKAAEAAVKPAEEKPAAKTEAPAVETEDKKAEAPVEEAVKEEKTEAPVEESGEAPTIEEKEETAENKEDKEEKKEKEPMDPEKKSRLVKSFKIFGIVLAVIVAASLIYYFVFGTNNAPSDSGPGVTESQQYEDIDQLIEDLE